MADDKELERIVAEMTLAEKVAVCHGDQRVWGGLFQMAMDFYHREPFRSGAVPRLGVPGVAFVDGPRGVVLLGGATTFPVPMARGASWDPALEEQIGDAIGKEVRSHGATLYGGVCVNLLRHPGWGRAQETYGEDPVGLGALGAALVRGVERHAMATVKHFALNSIENARFVVDVQADARTLHELYLPHFQDCIDAGATAVMSAYNSVNGEWAGQNKALLEDILVQRWGFEGFVLTDFVFGVRDAVKAMNGGQHLEMPFHMVFSENLAHAVHSGTVPVARLDDAVRRLVRAQRGIPDGDYPTSLRACDAHRALARRSAAASIVVLKNDHALLPLAPDARLAVIGHLASVPNLGDRGSSDTRPESVVTPLAGIEAAAQQPVTVHDGGDLDAAARAAAESEVAVVVVGLTHHEEGELVFPTMLHTLAHQFPPPAPLRWLSPRGWLRQAWGRWLARWTRRFGVRMQDRMLRQSFGQGGDRVDLALPADQVALIKAVAAANPRTVVVVMAGSAILMDWREAVPGILMLWYPGMEGGHALADILFGKTPPSGRMPFTTPEDPRHLPDFDPDATAVVYDLWHGYRRLDRDGNAAAFPLGAGLSTTTIQWEGLTVRVEADGLHVSLTLRNEGPRDGVEVVFVFVAPPGQAVARPRRELKGFARVEVPVGASAPVEITIGLRRLAYWDIEADGFRLEGGTHHISAARHAEDEGLQSAVVLAAQGFGGAKSA